MNFKEYKNLDYAQVADEILAFWKEENIFQKSIETRQGKPTFTFYEGPPSANGTPGIHHVMARAIKDIFCRYQTLKGKQVKRKGGWDTHGLPVELQVEKELGITKEDIGKKITVEEYNQKCRETVMKFTNQWNDLTEKMGYWVDLDEPYVTYENKYIESVWSLLQKLYKKGLLYKGYTIQPYSPAAGTGLSSHELNQPGCYRDVKDTSITAQFKIADQDKYLRLLDWYKLDLITFENQAVKEGSDLKLYRKEIEQFLYETTKGKSIFNPTLNQNIQITKRGLKEVLSFSPTFEDVFSLTKLLEIVANSIWIETEKSLYDKGETFHYLLHGISINNKNYVVKIVIKQIGLDYRLYDLTLTEKEKSQVFGIARISESDDDKHLGHRKDSRLFEILKINNQKFLEKHVFEPNIHILAWTTTPWTLPSNSALTVGKNIEYAIVKTFNPYTFLPVHVILAKDLIRKYFSEKGKDADFTAFKEGDKIIPWSIIDTCKGSDLEGIEYEQLMPYVQPQSAAFRVIIGDFVTTEDGTGVVHTAPTFGADDFRVAAQNNIPAILVKDENGKDMPLVDRRGRFVKQVKDFALEYVKEAYYSEAELETEKKKQGRDKYLSVDERIAIKLKTENKAFNVQRFDHPYPHCWRTDKPVLYYPLDSWFIRTTAVKKDLIELNHKINWKPESTGTGRFGNWLENLVDWNLSRSRYWGTPLPIWRTENGDDEICIGSVAELLHAAEHALKDDVLTAEQRSKNEDFVTKAKAFLAGGDSSIKNRPHPQPLSRGEGGATSHIFTTENENWKALKPFARENRKNQTESEEIVWQALRNKQLGDKFRRQHAIGQYIVDFVSIEKKLIVEIDGKIHEQNDNPQYDTIRTNFLNAEGFEVVRFTNKQVLDSIETVIESIKGALLQAKFFDEEITPLPWRGAGGEVSESIENNYLLDLHRPFVDEVYLVSPTGQVMSRELDLIDVWFDSGAMPFAQWHYPFENEEVFKQNYPADFISEGVDQTRGWFFTLHAISTMVEESVAFKNVVSTGLVLDKDGNKMSKRLGNAVDPFKTLQEYGADPTRWYMITNAQPWDNLKFDLKGVTEVRNKFFGTLTNTYNFFALYANLDGYKVEQFNRLPYHKLSELDQWIISKLLTLVKEVDAAYESYEPTKAGRAITDFVCDQLSNWYVRLGRRRFWQGQMTEDKQAAYETLQHCLVAVAQLMSPIAPFYGDWLYRNLTNHVREESVEKNTPFKVSSVHLSDFHTDIPEWSNPELEASMDLAQRICSLVHSIRKTNRIKVRQPLAKILIPVLNEKTRAQIKTVEELIKTEVNIKAIDYLDDASGVLSKKVKPNFKALGPKFGKDMKAVADVINQIDPQQLSQIEQLGKFEINGFEIELEHLDIQTEDLPGYLSAKDNELLVALDTEISLPLKQEGLAREVVNRVQNYRKDNGFEVTDKIKIEVVDNDKELTNSILAFKDYIAQEVQALQIEVTANANDAAVLEIDDLQFVCKISKI